MHYTGLVLLFRTFAIPKIRVRDWVRVRLVGLRLSLGLWLVDLEIVLLGLLLVGLGLVELRNSGLQSRDLGIWH